MARSGEAPGNGSSTVTSSAAPLICRRVSASTSAGSSTTRPRAALRNIRRRLHAAERIGIDQLLGFRRQRAGQGNEIGLRQQCLELGHRVHRIRVSSTGTWVAADADHPHVERLGELREPAADLSEADDQQRLAAEFVLSLRDVARSFRARPVLPGCRGPREAGARAPALVP
jgi:hypothetical protein